MRPHLAPKIRDEGLRGASKMMDDNLSVFGKIVEIVRPLLHHAAALGEVLRVVVGGAEPRISLMHSYPVLIVDGTACWPIHRALIHNSDSSKSR